MTRPPRRGSRPRRPGGTQPAGGRRGSARRLRAAHRVSNAELFLQAQLPSGNLLSPTESSLCASNGLLPEQFLGLKSVYIQRHIRAGCLSAARTPAARPPTRRR